MPVGTLDDETINSQGLGKPIPRRRREPEEVRPVVPAPVVSEEEPLRMPNPIPQDESEVQVPETEELTTSELYKKILSPELREITKKILTQSDDGKALLDEININISPVVNDDNNQLSAWELECLQQIRSSLSQFQEIEDLEVLVAIQVNLPLQPFTVRVSR